jgi:hypothetical protein
MNKTLTDGNSDPSGYGYHGDFLNGWDIPTLQQAINECNAESGNIEECAAFTLRSDDDMAACKVLPRVNEATVGVLGALPGCNPVQAGPEPAVPQSGCGAVTEIGDPILPFTDVSQKLGWKYVACAKDPAGQSRTLTDLFFDQPDMTVEKCISICADKGSKYAGVEYSSQCFCGNNVAPDRLPTNGTIGDCTMPCSGAPNELCGGAARVSVYIKCDDPSHCVNYDDGPD